MKKVNSRPLPGSGAPAPKFGKKEAARQEFWNTLNRLAQLTPHLDPGFQEPYLTKLRTLMAISTADDSVYRRWTNGLESELANVDIQQLWTRLSGIEREALDL